MYSIVLLLKEMNQYISCETAVPYCYNYYYLSDHFFNFAEKSPHCSVIISIPRSIYGKVQELDPKTVSLMEFSTELFAAESFDMDTFTKNEKMECKGYIFI